MNSKKDDVLKQGTREKIYEIIKQQPGICIRELERTAEIGIGQVSHHVSVLLKNKLIKEERDGFFRRFFPDFLCDKERLIISIFRREAVSKIIPFILKNERVTNSEISKNFSISPATTSWHINRMKKNNLITEERRGKFVCYSIKNKEDIFYIYKI